MAREVTVSVNSAGSGTVENTDQTYQETVNAGATEIVPDITVTQLDDTTTTTPAAKDLDVDNFLGAADVTVTALDDTTSTVAVSTAITTGIDVDDHLGATPAQSIWDSLSDAEKGAFVYSNNAEIATHLDGLTWDEMVTAFGIGYSYPPIKQDTSQNDGDAAWIEDTIFSSIRYQGLKAFNALTSDPTVLKNNNVFGNTNRFTDDLGTAIYANSLIIDHYRGLMWYNAEQTSVNRTTAFTNASALITGGYADWLVPTIEMYEDIFDTETASPPLWQSPFTALTTTLGYHTSTNQANAATTNGYLAQRTATISTIANTLNRGWAAVRVMYQITPEELLLLL